VALKHQDLSLEHGFIAQREVNSHLVAIEVGIERGTCQRVKLNGLTLDEFRLECHHRKTVERGSTVEEHRVTLHDILEDVPNDGFAAIDDLLGTLHGLYDTALNELANDERLVKLCRHQLRETALANLQLGTDNDNRTCGIVDTLTEQVLTETALLTLERVGERLERTVGLALHGTGLAAVVEKRVYGLLQHTLLVAENHLGGLDFHQSLQTVVTDDDATIEVIEVGGGETATIQRHQRTQLGRDDRNNLEDHPFGIVHGRGATESLYNLKTLQSLGLAHLAGIVVGTVAKLIAQGIEVEVFEQVKHSLGTHLGNELVRIAVIEQVVVGIQAVVDNIEVLFL